MESKEIKSYLKSKGIDTKKVSIKHKWCGYSESFDITIKDINININEVEKLVKQFESIDYDEVTGEILQGGNSYIFVAYDYDTIKEANQKYNPMVLDILYKELSTRTEEEQKHFYNGDINPVLTLGDKIICYRDGKSYMIRELENYATRRSYENCLAETLIQMGLLRKVIGE